MLPCSNNVRIVMLSTLNQLVSLDKVSKDRLIRSD